jgi:type IV pilus assembly protein PilP
MRARALLSHATPAITMALVVLASCSLDPKPAPTPPASNSAVDAPAPPPPPPVMTGSVHAFEPPERDPFAGPQTSTTIVTPPPRDEVPRKAKKYSLDQLKLVGIVTGEEQRAMLVDPRGKGWIVSRGDHVGRPDVRSDRFAGWRVHRIKAEEIVFVRDDAVSNANESETRVLALHAEAAATDVDD